MAGYVSVRLPLYIMYTVVLKDDFAALSIQDLMGVLASWGLELFEFLRVGASTGWFGLSCPLHCGNVTWPALGFAFLLGFFFGISLLASIAIWIWCYLGPLPSSSFRPPAPANPPSHSAAARLRGYLNE